MRVQLVRWPNKHHLGRVERTGRPFAWAKKVDYLCVIYKKERGGNSAHGGVPPWGPQATRAESARAGVL
jgi:hypothetical protein